MGIWGVMQCSIHPAVFKYCCLVTFLYLPSLDDKIIEMPPQETYTLVFPPRTTSAAGEKPTETQEVQV